MSCFDGVKNDAVTGCFVVQSGDKERTVLIIVLSKLKQKLKYSITWGSNKNINYSNSE